MSYCRDKTIARMVAQDAADATGKHWRFFADSNGVFHVEPHIGPLKECVVVTPRQQHVREVYRTRVVRSRGSDDWYVFAYDEKNDRIPNADYQTGDCDTAHRVAMDMVRDHDGCYCTNTDCLRAVQHYFRVIIASSGKVIDSGLCLPCADKLSREGRGRTVKYDHIAEV